MILLNGKREYKLEQVHPPYKKWGKKYSKESNSPFSTKIRNRNSPKSTHSWGLLKKSKKVIENAKA